MVKAADERTLILASLPWSKRQLQQLVCFQEMFIRHVEARLESGASRPQALAEAHVAGMAAAGLNAPEVERGCALLRAFCGRRWALQQVRARFEQLQGGPVWAHPRTRDEWLQDLARLEDTGELKRRYGAQVVLLLLEHEAALVPLHARFVRALGKS